MEACAQIKIGGHGSLTGGAGVDVRQANLGQNVTSGGWGEEGGGVSDVLGQGAK